jgi:hypothetical protein
MCNDKKSKQEKGTGIDIHFLRDAAKNGNHQALETLQRVDQLNEEHQRIKASVIKLTSLPRLSFDDHAKFYQAAIPAMDRLLAIPIEINRIIHKTLLYN